ncbi:MAG: PEP-CTERM sorting domain-containing protein [Pyrinomonadaceae bacterium]|nr:PEP-CTERM sorting domain-containing protein [Phycisphaerales bacterium]
MSVVKNVRTMAMLAGLAALPLAAQAQLSIVASAVPFIDISATGTSIGTISDDSETTLTGAALLGAGFNGNGLLAGNTSIRIGNNGGVLWGNSATDTFTNALNVGYINSTVLPTMAASNLGDTGNGGSGPRQFLAPLWDDNTPLSGAGSIRWQVIAGNLIVQWSNEDHFNATGNGTVTYQMIVRGGVAFGSGNSFVDFVYADTLYSANLYQNDGGSATIGYKNWGVNPLGNDVEYGLGGGTGTLADPAFGGANMQPKVSGSIAGGDVSLTHSVSIIPAPSSIALLGIGGLLAARRRRA